MQQKQVTLEGMMRCRYTKKSGNMQHEGDVAITTIRCKCTKNVGKIEFFE